MHHALFCFLLRVKGNLLSQPFSSPFRIVSRTPPYVSTRSNVELRETWFRTWSDYTRQNELLSFAAVSAARINARTLLFSMFPTLIGNTHRWETNGRSKYAEIQRIIVAIIIDRIANEITLCRIAWRD